MKKGIVVPKKLSHKNGVSKLKAGEEVTENDVNNFDELVGMGCIAIEESEEEESEEEESEEEESELMKLKKDELQKKCDELEIEYTQDDNKSELVARIEEAEKAK